MNSSGSLPGPSSVPEFADVASQSAWWTDRIHEWQASGTSQGAFSKARGIPLTTFNWWKRRILKQAPGRKRVRRVLAPESPAAPSPRRGRVPDRKARRRSSPHTFVPVRVVPSAPGAAWALEVACRGGRVLRLREWVEPSRLAALVAALESQVLTVPPAVRIYVRAAPTDMRKSFDGLAALAREIVQQDPFSGHLFVFCNRKADRVKVLWWDRSGFVLWYKRLEEGRFRFFDRDAPAYEMEAAELALILEGIELAGARRRKRYRRPEAL